MYIAMHLVLHQAVCLQQCVRCTKLCHENTADTACMMQIVGSIQVLGFDLPDDALAIGASVQAALLQKPYCCLEHLL